MRIFAKTRIMLSHFYIPIARFSNLFLFLALVAISAVSCQNTTTKEVTPKSISKADSILNLTFEAHGISNFSDHHISFDFRNRTYSISPAGNSFEYGLEFEKEGHIYQDHYTDTSFVRSIDGATIELTEEDKNKYSSSLNSVLYFATLPLKLKDKAVILTYKGEANVKGNAYSKLQVTFEKEGGGTDHDDAFMYWINSKSKRIDYFAYSYNVNEGGVRFRVAINPKTKSGILFQDYENYKATVGTALEDLPLLYEQDSLELLSLIVTENIKVIR